MAGNQGGKQATYRIIRRKLGIRLDICIGIQALRCTRLANPVMTVPLDTNVMTVSVQKSLNEFLNNKHRLEKCYIFCLPGLTTNSFAT